MASPAVASAPPAEASQPADAADPLTNAVQFLSNPRVRTAPLAQRIAFLRKKGCSEEVIAQALRKVAPPRQGYSAPAPSSTPQSGEPPSGEEPPSADSRKEGSEKGGETTPREVEWRPWTLEELSEHTGGDGKRLLLGCKGLVYEVSPDFYGPGKAYSKFAGKDCSWHLGKVKVGDENANRSWSDLTEKDVKVLDDWEEKYQQKYDCVGWITTEWAYPGEPPARPVRKADAKPKQGCAQQ